MSVSQYIQLASHDSDTNRARRHVTFTNLSSQQMFPGSLVQYFQDQGSMIPMPFNFEQLPNKNAGDIAQQYSLNNTSYSSSTSNNLKDTFQQQNRINNAIYLTPQMKAIGVPGDNTELRATDFS